MDADQAREIIISLFAVDSVWSVVLRGGVWFGIAVVIILSTDSANAATSSGGLKRNLGFFLLFLIVSGGLVYLLFGFTASSPVSASTLESL